MKPKAVILLSAGLDSLTALSQAVKENELVLALTFDYGQRAARQEIRNARKLAKFYKIPHKVIKLNWFKQVVDSALLNKKQELPRLKSLRQANKQTAKAVWVPNRNGLFLNIAAVFAEKLRAPLIIAGFNAEEAQTFPDNSSAFCRAADQFFSFSTLNQVKVKNYFAKMTKPEIFRLALANRAPLQYVWPCYEGKTKICGVCESCLRFLNARKAALCK